MRGMASAMATTLNDRRARSCVSQGYFSGFCLARLSTDCAPDRKNTPQVVGRLVSRSARPSVCSRLNLVGVPAQSRRRRRGGISSGNGRAAQLSQSAGRVGLGQRARMLLLRRGHQPDAI
jgi:hypothetical protein